MWAWPAGTGCSSTGAACKVAIAPRFEPAHRLLMNRTVEGAVIENDARAILDDGLAYDRCHVGIVTDLALDPAQREALARHDIASADQLHRVLRTQVDVVLPDGVAVLNAGDPRVAELAELCDGEVMFYAADEAAATSEALTAHRAAGGRAVLLRDGRIVLATGTQEQPLVDLGAHRGAAPAAVRIGAEVLAAAAGAAWAMGVSPDLMAAGIETFDPQSPAVPGGR